MPSIYDVAKHAGVFFDQGGGFSMHHPMEVQNIFNIILVEVIMEQ